MKKVAMLAAGVAVVAAIAIPAEAKAPISLAAAVSGEAEVPGPGDPDGKGSADLTVTIKKDRPKAKICFDLVLKKIDGATAGHIHEGGPTVAGDVVVTLFEDPAGLPVPGAFEGCVRAPKADVKPIKRNPEGFYVNVHNKEFPGGAIRGQLGAHSR